LSSTKAAPNATKSVTDRRISIARQAKSPAGGCKAAARAAGGTSPG
jgi:hypothetical protein